VGRSRKDDWGVYTNIYSSVNSSEKKQTLSDTKFFISGFKSHSPNTIKGQGGTRHKNTQDVPTAWHSCSALKQPVEVTVTEKSKRTADPPIPVKMSLGKQVLEAHELHKTLLRPLDQSCC